MKSKRTEPIVDGLVGNRFAVMTGGGSYYVADPDAPLEHGCPCVIQVGPGRYYTEATVVTKSPHRAKKLAIKVEGGVIECGVEKSRVARIVGRFIAFAAFLRALNEEGERP